MFGFAKNDKDNIEDDELEDLQTIASQWLNDAATIARDVKAGILIEVKCHDPDKKENG